MATITITYLAGPDIDKLAMTDDEILGAAMLAKAETMGLGQTLDYA